MIFDCFTFLNELEVLELRLMELYDTVDYFVLVEANKTHAGNPKEFVFEEYKDNYRDYLDKIIYVKVMDLPNPLPTDARVPEKFQRNAIMRGLANAQEGDKILVSDVDEIPNVEVIRDNLNNDREWAIAFQQHMFYFYVNCQLVGRPWAGTVMSSIGKFDTPQRLRNLAQRRTSFNYLEKPSHGLYPNGGWHYSFLTGGDAVKIKYKADNVAEACSITLTIEEITERVNNNQDIYMRRNRRLRQSIVDFSNKKPRMMDKFLEKYPHFLRSNN